MKQELIRKAKEWHTLTPKEKADTKNKLRNTK